MSLWCVCVRRVAHRRVSCLPFTFGFRGSGFVRCYDATRACVGLLVCVYISSWS